MAFVEEAQADTPMPAEEAAPEEPAVAPVYAERVVDPANVYLMTSMMQDVIRRGTGRKAMSLGRKDLAGKTGTTNDQRDAWFNGFNQHMVAVTWLGFDDVEPLGRGEVGGRAALPAWIDFMKVALSGVEEKTHEMPPGMVTMRIDVDTGEPVGAGRGNAIFEVFEEKNAPTLPETGPGGRPGPRAGDSHVAPAEDPF